MAADAFPAGLRVLVVDHDPAWLKILQKMLLKNKYQVSICNLAQEALDLLENRRDGFDIVMCDVNVPDMDGFKFLEQVGLKMDIPVIMMSVDGETSRVMKGVQHGACDYLLKPIRMKELRNIWQHVFRKRMRGVRNVETKESFEETLKSEDSSNFSGDMAITCKKRKDFDQKSIESSDPSSTKKARVVWTKDLHNKFVMAVNHIGLDKVGPKKILDLMGVPWLSRENVASHLQKYRLNLSRKHKGGNDINLPDFTLQQNIVINENYASATRQEIHIHRHSSSTCEGNVGGILAMPVQGQCEKLLFGDVSHTQMNRSSRIGYNQPFELVKSEADHYTSSSLFKPHFQPEHRFDHLPVVSYNHGQHVQPLREVYQDENQAVDANINYLYNKNRSYAIGNDHHHTTLSFPEEKNNNMESSVKNMIVGTTGSTLNLRDELNPFDMHVQNHQHASLESFGRSNQEDEFGVASDAGPELYEAPHFEYDNNNGGEWYVRDHVF